MAENEEDVVIESDEEEESNRAQFRKLQQFLDKEDVYSPISVPVKISRAELLLLLIKFALVYLLGLSIVSSIFSMVNCIFATPVLPQSRYLIDKLFNPSNSAKFHGLCTQRGIRIGTFTHSDSKMHCEICDIDVDVKDPMYKDFFVTLDPSSRITNLLKANSDYYDHVMNVRCPEKHVIQDIYDGKQYQRFVKTLDPTSKNNYVTLRLIQTVPLFSRAHRILFGQFTL